MEKLNLFVPITSINNREITKEELFIYDFTLKGVNDYYIWISKEMNKNEDVYINRWIHLFYMIYYFSDREESIPDINFCLPESLEDFMIDFKNYDYKNIKSSYKYPLNMLLNFVYEKFGTDNIGLIKARVDEIVYYLKNSYGFDPSIYDKVIPSKLDWIQRVFEDEWDEDDYIQFGNIEWFLLEFRNNFFNIHHSLGDDWGKVVRKLAGKND